MTELMAFPDACQLQSILEAARQQGRRGTEALAAIRKIHAAPKLTLFIEDLRALMALPRGRLPCAVPDEQVMDVVAELTKIGPVHLIGMIRPMARRLGGSTATPTPEMKPKSQRVRIEPHSDPEALFGRRGVQSLKTAAQELFSLMNALRCAIYTRKSTEEGLEQEFNSLQAQREAGEAYVRSQQLGGWVALADRYDDGGFSGASLERPALKQLLSANRAPVRRSFWKDTKAICKPTPTPSTMHFSSRNAA